MKKPDAQGVEWQRLIVDARMANACHRAPPVAQLASAGGMAELDLSPLRLEASGFDLATDRPDGQEGD
eukprot:5239876-Lingulodinium_polyedra.AAC.1